MAGEHEEFLALTHAKFIKGRSDETTRKLPELAMLRDKGQINYNQTGTSQTWAVKWIRRDLDTHADMAEVAYTRKIVSKDATLTYKAQYEMNDAIAWSEQKKNKGREALLVMYKNKAKDMMRDARAGFTYDMYIDGTVAGNELRMDGIDTIFQQAGTVTASEYMINNGTYLGITTTKGAYGEASHDDPQYDFWSAVGVNCVFTGNTWVLNADDLISKAILQVLFGMGEEDMTDLFVLRKSSYLSFLALLRTKERWIADNTNLQRLGFGANKNIAINYDGVDVTWSDAVPATDSDGKIVHGYGWNFDHVTLEWLAGQLFEDGTVYDEKQHAYLFWLIAGGNLKFSSPRHQLKLAEWPG